MEGREGGGRKRGRKGVREQRRHFASGGLICFFPSPWEHPEILQNIQSEGAELSWSDILKPHSGLSLHLPIAKMTKL